MAPNIDSAVQVREAETDDILTALVEVNNDKQIQPYVARDPEDESNDISGPLTVRFAVEEELPYIPPKINFLDWPAFDAATLPARTNPKKSRLSKILSPLKSVRVGLPGDVSVEGFGGLIESAHSLFHSVQRLDYMESQRRIHLLPGQPNTPSPKTLPRLELERFENELFDLSKYDGFSTYLTALTWTEEAHARGGSITLYEVLFGEADETVGIRPVAAMRDVPTPVLVKMRTNERVRRKVVFAPVNDDDLRLKWRANAGRRPTYVRLGGGGSRRPVSPPLRAGSRTRSRSRHPGKLADGEGVCATIPQFVALLHARRAIVEDVKSSNIAPLRTAEGDVRPTVALVDPPRANPHDGDGVHVAVMFPSDAPWADEEIVWTDRDGLVEFRQAKYWHLIEPVRSRGGRSKSRRREESRGRDIHAGRRSESRARSWSRARSRSRGRHMPDAHDWA